jgi:hypothetical protein
MRAAALAALVLLTGCHPRIRLASPQINRAPEICVVFVQGEKINEDVARAAIEACREPTKETR